MKRPTSAIMGILLVTASAFIAYHFWFADPYAYGRASAERDIAAGLLKLKVYGPPPPPWYQEYIRLLHDRYGIQLVGVAGCIVSKSLTKEVAGYNDKMHYEIYTRFDGDVLESAAREAKSALGHVDR